LVPRVVADMQWVMNAFENAVKSIAMVILIIGAGGD
jgi:high-affinity gluconate transporter